MAAPDVPDSATAGEVTRLLRAWSGGDRAALGDLMPLVYADLRRLARACLKDERALTVQATSLVHDVYCQLLRQDRMEWVNRQQFFYTAARLMRRLIVDAARERHAGKRGGEWTRVLATELSDVPAPEGQLTDDDLIALDRALDALELQDPVKARVVELRFFTGLDVTETAAALAISESTVKRHWRAARLWLHRELRGRTDGT